VSFRDRLTHDDDEQAEQVVSKLEQVADEQPTASDDTVAYTLPPGAFGLTSAFPERGVPFPKVDRREKAYVDTMLEATRLRKGKKPSERLQKLLSTEQLRGLGYDVGK
jgi:hypothetical protein